MSVDFRGEGDAAGLDFGPGYRFLAKPSEKWQTLAIDVVLGDRLQMTLNDNKSPSIDEVKDIQANLLPPFLNLLAKGGAVEFRNLHVDGVPFVSPVKDEEDDGLLPAQQLPEDTKRIGALGWEVSNGVWKLENDGITSGASVEGNDLITYAECLPGNQR